ncbi:MAG: hypothetical protein ABIO65_09795 [Nitrospiria bacterium]
MDDRRIDKQSRRISVELSDGSRLDGEVFLRLYEAHHDGPQTVGDLLNEDASLIPLKTGDGVVLVNPAQIVTVTIESEHEPYDLTTLGDPHTVRIMTARGREVLGQVFISLPGGSGRVKDFFKRSVRFVPVFLDHSIIYVNQAFVLYVRD